MFLLPPYSLTGTCNSVQNCASRRPVGRGKEEHYYVQFWWVAASHSLQTLHYRVHKSQQQWETALEETRRTSARRVE
jgi:hypothetical protein